MALSMQLLKKLSSPLSILFLSLGGIALSPFIGKIFYLYSFFDLLASLYLRALTLIIVPLVFCSIICGLNQFLTQKGIKKTALFTFYYFLLTNLLALCTALLFSQIFSPMLKRSAFSLSPIATTIPTALQGNLIKNLLLEIVPNNIFLALVKGEMLGIIFFALIFGVAMSKLHEAKRQTLMQIGDSLLTIFLQIMRWLLQLLPLAVFAIGISYFAKIGFSRLLPLATFSLIAILAMLFYVFAILAPLYTLIVKKSFFVFLRKLFPLLITTFATSSSSASLPKAYEICEKKLSIPSYLTRLIFPLGTSLNMAASSLFAFLATYFLFLIYHLPLSPILLTTLFFTSLIVSMGMAGAPSAALLSIMLIAKIFSLPTEIIGYLFALDRIVDMFRSTINTLTITVTTTLVHHLEIKQKTVNPLDF